MHIHNAKVRYLWKRMCTEAGGRGMVDGEVYLFASLLYIHLSSISRVPFRMA